ncbi:MAG: nitroreductase family protein [Candidatus Methanoperedens sp.]|nr:nitroreductase family protein [Candidatus Methanoperedens sp.]
MEVLEALRTRRSIRKYTRDDVPDSDIRIILEAGMSGPSAVNSQPWHFIVITSRSILNEIPKASLYAQMAKDAAIAIVICGDPALDKIPLFWQQDCCIAAQNILLAAHSLGYGAVWTAAYPLEDRVLNLQKLLGIPSNIIPLAVIPIGRPAEKMKGDKPYLEERVHLDGW